MPRDLGGSLGVGRFLVSEVPLHMYGNWSCEEGGPTRASSVDVAPAPSAHCVDTNPCRMTGLTLHSHVHCKEI